MLNDLVKTHRDEILARTRARVDDRLAEGAEPRDPEQGLSRLLEGIGRALTEGRTTLAEAVHDYGQLREVVADLARELRIPLSPEALRTLHLSLDEALAHTVAEHAAQKASALGDRKNERMGFFAHEIANLATSATLAFDALKSSRVGVGGSTGAVLDRNLARLRNLAEGSLAEVRLDAGLHHRERLALDAMVEEAGAAAALEAVARGLQITVSPVEPGVVIEADRHLLAAALGNLLQNACKYSRPRGHIVLSTDTSRPDDRVLIEVEDECGGLSPDVAATLFQPFRRRTSNRTGLGLGLAIAQESVIANGGELRFRSLPDQGCIFTIEMPRFLVGGKEWQPQEWRV